jgi:hypothetical protein
MSYWKKEIKSLEDIYQEKLRLDGPAKYWYKRASAFKIQGVTWAIILFAVLFTGFMEFSSFFKLWLKGQELDIELSTMQGAAIFITIVSAFAFLVTILAKMTLSSFHLQRTRKNVSNSDTYTCHYQTKQVLILKLEKLFCNPCLVGPIQGF